ncbi:MAG: recombinase family protein [Clostridiales bacterium]|nr:recombinase family protein [Clostridiales bacterium]
MERIVTQTRFVKTDIARPKRVAAYARVSSGKDAMLHSLAAQVNYYSKLIQSHSGWEYVGVYADEALTGTKESRENFQRLLADCRSGKIDMVITKSISRFARNTVTLLETVRELKSLEVDVYFEEQNIHSVNSDGELMLTILASYAQEESLSASENQKWRVRQNFQNGKPWRGYMMGYRYDGEKYVIVPKEAEVVRSIFRDYLDGKGVAAIMKRLNEEGILTQQGYTWHQSAVRRILRNYAYTGNLLLQTKFRENHLTKRTLVNRGELPQYHAENTHEPIIDIDTYNLVQLEMARRAERFAKPQAKAKYPFTGHITCAGCGKHYRRKVTKTGPVWICATYNTLGKKACPSKAIPEPNLMALAAEIGDFSKITAITADKDNTLMWSQASFRSASTKMP